MLDVVLDFPFYILLSITSSSNAPVRTIVCEFLLLLPEALHWRACETVSIFIVKLDVVT